MSPLWGSSPRPYAYEAHALPAELRRLTQSALLENHGVLPDDPASMGRFELGTNSPLHFPLAWLAFTGRRCLARRTRGCCKRSPQIKPITFRPSRFFGGCFFALSGFGRRFAAFRANPFEAKGFGFAITCAWRSLCLSFAVADVASLFHVG